MTPAAVLLRRSLGPLLLVAVLAGVASAVVSAKVSRAFEAALTLTVPSPVRESPRSGRAAGGKEDTAFEALQSAELFAETLQGWLSSPDFAAAVYARANVAFQRTSVRQLSRAFTAVKRGGPVVDVRLRARSAEEGRAMTRALVEEVGARVEAFNAETGGSGFRATASEPIVIPVYTSPPLRGIVAGVVAFVLGINLVFLRDFLRPAPRHEA